MYLESFEAFGATRSREPQGARLEVVERWRMRERIAVLGHVLVRLANQDVMPQQVREIFGECRLADSMRAGDRDSHAVSCPQSAQAIRVRRPRYLSAINLAMTVRRSPASSEMVSP